MDKNVMRSDIFLSIVIPVYNVEKYLARCLDSILKQQVEFSYEIIAVNDCSTDSSYSILLDYKKKYHNIVLVNHKSNQKLSNYWYNHPNEGYHENAAASNRNTWNHWVSVWDYNAGVLRQYTNGVKAATDASTQGNASAGTTLLIGQENGGRQFSGGISIIRMYNTSLSSTQVQQNYNALKSRFGL